MGTAVSPRLRPKPRLRLRLRRRAVCLRVGQIGGRVERRQRKVLLGELQPTRRAGPACMCMCLHICMCTAWRAHALGTRHVSRGWLVHWLVSRLVRLGSCSSQSV